MVHIFEALATVVRFFQPVGLYHRAHRAVQNQNALLQSLLEQGGASGNRSGVGLRHGGIPSCATGSGHHSSPPIYIKVF